MVKIAVEPLMKRISEMTGSGGQGSFISFNTAVVLLTQAIDGLTRFLDFIIPILDNVTSATIKIINVMNALQSAITFAIAVGIKLFTEFSNTVKGLWSQLPATISGIWSGITGFLSAQAGAFYTIGVNIVQGLLNGLKAKMVEVMKWVRSMADQIKNTFRNAMQIKSPSRVFESFGNMIGEGLRIGIEYSMGKAVSAVSQNANKIKASMGVLKGVISGIKDEFGDFGDVVSGVNTVFGELNNQLLSKANTRLEGEEEHALRIQAFEDELNLLELKKLEKELIGKNTDLLDKQIDIIEKAKKAEELKHELTIGKQKQEIKNMQMFGTSSEKSFDAVFGKVAELAGAIRPVSDLMNWGSFAGVKNKEGLYNTIEQEANKGVSISVNMGGIITRSRAELRDVAGELINLVNEELKARNIPQLAGGVLLGGANV